MSKAEEWNEHGAKDIFTKGKFEMIKLRELLKKWILIESFHELRFALIEMFQNLVDKITYPQEYSSRTSWPYITPLLHIHRNTPILSQKRDNSTLGPGIHPHRDSTSQLQTHALHVTSRLLVCRSKSGPDMPYDNAMSLGEILNLTIPQNQWQWGRKVMVLGKALALSESVGKPVCQ